MKSQPILIHLTSGMRRLAAVFLIGILLPLSVGCSGPGFGTGRKDNATAIEKLEKRFAQLESDREAIVFWQALAAVFFVLAGFALVGGAALGSRARRDRAHCFGRPGERTQTSYPDQPAL